MAKNPFSILFRRWHRRLGLVWVLFVLPGITGLLFIQIATAGPDQAPRENPVLRQRDGVVAAPAPLLTQTLPGGELLARDGRLRIGDRDIGPCPRLVGVVVQAGRVLAVCSNRLWLLTPEGEVIDQADSRRGVPEGLSAVGQGEGRVLLRRGDESMAVDLADLSLKPALPAPGVNWTEAAPAPVAGQDWRQSLPDLLGGRLSGAWSGWLPGVVAILCLGLVGAGLARWWRHRRT